MEERYERASSVLRRLIEPLLGQVPPGCRAKRVLELGAASGQLAPALRARFPQARMVVSDTSDTLLLRCRERLSLGGAPQRTAFVRIQPEGACPAGLGHRATLVASNGLVPTLSDLRAHLALVEALLEPGGLYLVSGFLPGNLPELRQALRRSVWPEPAREALAGVGREQNLQLRSFAMAELPVRYGSAEGLFSALHRTGGAVRRTVLQLDASRLAALKANYQRRYGDDAGVVATWTPWFALLQKGA